MSVSGRLLVAVACLMAVTIASCGFLEPETVYVRTPQILKVAWGKDGYLYFLVRWVVSEERQGTVIATFDKVVYRLDADAKLLRRLPPEEGDLLASRWPSAGWVGGRYALVTRTVRDPVTKLYSYPVEFHDWVKGETIAWKRGSVLAFSPDDRYLIWSDTTRHELPVIHWMDSGVDIPVPDSVLVFRDYIDVEHEHRIIRQDLITGDTVDLTNSTTIKHLNRPFYPTIHGLLDPGQQILIDPVTFETKPGWYVTRHIGGTRLGPDGKSNTDNIRAGGIVINLRHPNAHIVWSGPAGESSSGKLPSIWLDISSYPDIAIPLTVRSS